MLFILGGLAGALIGSLSLDYPAVSISGLTSEPSKKTKLVLIGLTGGSACNLAIFILFMSMRFGISQSDKRRFWNFNETNVMLGVIFRTPAAVAVIYDRHDILVEMFRHIESVIDEQNFEARTLLYG